MTNKWQQGKIMESKKPPIRIRLLYWSSNLSSIHLLNIHPTLVSRQRAAASQALYGMGRPPLPRDYPPKPDVLTQAC
jgi:hypothetical protein